MSFTEVAPPAAEPDSPPSSPQAASTPTEHLTVCLSGAPNAGKTSLMNALTGGSFHTANYPGATVSLSRGKTKAEFGPEFLLIDLPGVQSVVQPSLEEELAVHVLEGRHPSVKPDALIVVVDATQLERHLKLAGTVARTGKPMVVALTMTDLLSRSGQSVNTSKLTAALGVPVIEVDGRTGWGAGELVETLRKQIASPPAPGFLSNLPKDPVEAFRAVRDMLASSGALRSNGPLALATDSVTARIDRVVLHPYLGFPIFLLALAVLFASIFWLAQPFMDWIEAGFALASEMVASALPESLLTRFIAEGLIGGVGAVAVFFPQIVILFFLMTLLEDSGYLARGAALVDRPLSAFGLHGRSFVPMLSGFACAIPAVLAARTIPSKRERLLTIWIIPLMSCSARLPVYALLLAALLPGAAGKAGLALAAIYFSSLLIGSLTAGIISRFVLRKREASMLAMELPAYRKPLVKPVLRMTWTRSAAYLKRAGTTIVVISAILWLLSNFGLGARQPVEEGAARSAVVTPAPLDHSFAAEAGRLIEPVLWPMGVDWRVGVGLISAFAAREVFVSSMAIVFHVTGEEEETQASGLLEEMRRATFENGQPIFTPATILGLIVFFFFSLQCLATVSVVRAETGSWRMAGLQLLFYTGLGYGLSVLTVQGLRLAGIQ